MTPIHFLYAGPAQDLARRQLHGESVAEFHAGALKGRSTGAVTPLEWEVRLGDNLLFDSGGLDLLTTALAAYSGPASRVEFHLVPDPIALRDYYGLHDGLLPDGAVQIPVEAVRASGAAGGTEILRVPLPSLRTPIPYPRALAEPTEVSAPHALLLAYGCDFDLLFANQIVLLAELRRRVMASPWTWCKALARRHPRSFGLRAACAYRSVHPTAEVHPTAAVEGSIIGPGARIGAHGTVRFSVIGPEARLHDGAKVEFSTVGRRSWLMHDLVLYRCHVEDEVFLIHGPYQFSSFHSGSAAFATILMDYLPQGGPFRVMTPQGLREYHGRFLGSVFREGAKALGGTLLAPGRIVPAEIWLGSDPAQVHRKFDASLPPRTPVGPDRKTGE